MADGDREVLSSLPRTRPERRSAKRAARPAAGPKPAPRARKPAARATRPARSAAPRREVPPAGYAVPRDASPVNAGGGELVGTAIQALGELAGLGTRVLRDALGRLPRP
jgi:hypothetical protein